MDINTLRGIATILVMIAFLGIVVWAYSAYKKKDFDEASQLPFADETQAEKAARERKEEEARSNKK